MIILTNTTDKIRVRLGGTVAANQAQCYASYRDTTTSTITPGRAVSLTNNATAIDLVAAPGASTQRIVDYISVHNSDTASMTVIVEFFDNTTLYTLANLSLGAGEKLEYQEGEGFKVFSTAGAIRVSDGFISPTAGNNLKYVLKSTDQTTNSNSFVSITGLEFPVVAGNSYWFRFTIPYDVTNTATGSAFAIGGSITATMYYYTDVTLTTANRFVQRGLVSFDAATASATSAATSGNIATVEGVIMPQTSGNVTARFRHQEISTVFVTQKGGAHVQYIEI